MEEIDKWVAEFFIRNQTNPRVSPSNFLSSLKLEDSPDCVNLKVSSVLRDISSSLIHGKVDEGTLDLLEILEKLIVFEKHSILMNSHKSAYCWTAVECTLRFMWPLSASYGLFADALERIWTKRVGILKESESDLVTVELLKWETDLKRALVDPQVYKRIRKTNVRYRAISFLNQVVKEKWVLLESSSLESVARKMFCKGKAQDVVDNRGSVDENMRRLESDSDTIDNTNEVCGERGEENGDSREKGYDVEVVGGLENDVAEKVNEEDVERTMGKQEEEYQPSLVDTDIVDNTDELRGEKEEENGNDREIVDDVEGLGGLENDVIEKVNETDEEQTMDKKEEEHQPSPVESDTDIVDNTNELCGEEEDENLNDREIVNDVDRLGGVENVANAEHQPGFDEGDKMVAQELKAYLLEIQRQIDHSTGLEQGPTNVTDQSEDVSLPHALVNKTETDDQGHNETPQQDSENETGSDSYGTRSGRVRHHLSPLKKESSHGRRKNKFWTPEEVEALKEGVKEYGKAWKDIKNANPSVFKERTEVDLKDKWRNL